MTITQALILGIVEGLTEFLPVSSTGHLILAAQALRIPESSFLNSFEIAIQLGAVLAVAVHYWSKLTRSFAVYQKISAAFLPTMILGLIFYKFVKNHLMNNTAVVVWALMAGGLVLLLFERFHKENPHASTAVNAITYRQAVLIGIFQSVAMIPGVSRAGATILGGLLIGLRRKAIVEFSFLLALPTILAATVLDLAKSNFSFSGREWVLLCIGLMTSFAVALVVIRWFLFFIRRHSFMPFGVYRIAVAVIFWHFLS